MPEDGKSKFMDAVRDKLRYKHYSLGAEQAHVGWIRRFVLFHRKRHAAYFKPRHSPYPS